eukprot:876477-Pelagomonas_calceolata.AAC.1
MGVDEARTLPRVCINDGDEDDDDDDVAQAQHTVLATACTAKCCSSVTHRMHNSTRGRLNLMHSTPMHVPAAGGHTGRTRPSGTCAQRV